MAVAAARPTSLLDRLRAHAARRAARPALHYFATTISYGRLAAEAAALARAFQALGVRRGDRVAVVLQNEPAAVVAHYATWMAGGIVVPLNVMFKARELEDHLRDAGACGVLCQQGDAGWVQPVAEAAGCRFLVTVAPELYLDPAGPWPAVVPPPGGAPPDRALDLGALLARYRNTTPAPVALEPDDVAYLHYTSGTTGPSKGAMITHANVLFNAATYERLCGLGAEDCVLGLAPLFHITGTIGHIAAACQVGAPLVLLHRFQAGEAIRQIAARRATFTVGAITAFLALLGDEHFSRDRLASLRKVFSGGAPVRPAVVARWEAATGTYLHNVWGMTETTSPGTWTPLGERAPVDPETGALAVGRPIPGLALRVVDVDTGRPLGPGEVGELVVRGPNVFKGYWNRPEETAHALREGWLHTGDLGKVDAAGWVYWIERAKDLINVSGFKVWPREVEEVLAAHPAVQEVAVIGVPDPYRGEAVKAVVVLKPEHRSAVDAAALAAFCRVRLANYKVPRVVELREALPRNPQGKLLKYLLRGEAGAEAR